MLHDAGAACTHLMSLKYSLMMSLASSTRPLRRAAVRSFCICNKQVQHTYQGGTAVLSLPAGAVKPSVDANSYLAMPHAESGAWRWGARLYQAIE